MEIKASSVYDIKSMKALVHLGIYKKKNPVLSYWIWTIIALTLISIFVIFRDFLLDSTYSILLISLLAFLTVMTSFSYSYFILPIISYRSMKKLAGIRVDFVFSEDSMYVHSDSDIHKTDSTMKYEALVKVMETEARLFLFQTKSQAFVVDKSTLEGGSIEDLRKVLMAVMGKKYVVCKY